ncbi:MAG: N-acetylmuramoyl-L-alanine amidase [Aliishimia sp.]
MIRLILSVAFWAMTYVASTAQPLTGLARVDVEKSSINDGWFGETEISLGLSLGVPFRVYTLNDPPRLVVDFSEVDFAGASSSDLLVEPGRISDLRFGPVQPGWSRLVADLAEPMLPDEVVMSSDKGSGAAILHIQMNTVDDAQFAARSGVPEGANWVQEVPEPKAQARAADVFRVVLDPGHGGVDPGAERDGLVEKEIVLDFSRTLRDLLRREGVDVVMTRDADVFVSLEGRTALAHRADASVFLSLHADALSQGGARGATVYTLSDKASDAASAQLAARHNRSDILAGLDLTGADDQVTSVLLDLARRETEPRSQALAEAVISGMDQVGGPMNRKPWREAGFSVLKSADIPSVLVEIGFLSSERDRKNLADPVWRSVIAAGIADSILAWRDADAARATLVRQ